MATKNEHKLMSIQAQSDLSAAASRYRCVTHLGALSAANLAAGAVGGTAGILSDFGTPRSGEIASVVYAGLYKAIAGAAITTPGWPVMVGSSGYIFAAASGGPTCGRAMESAASGDLFKGNFDFTTFPAWNGVG
jgi:hypothetical protein